MGRGPWVWYDVVTHLPPDLVALPAVIAGHRDGTPLRRFTGRSDSEQMVDDLEAQLDARGIGRLHIVGNSLGGWLALRLAERRRALSVLCLAPAGGWRPQSVGERLIVSRFVIGHRVARRLTRRPRLLAAPGVRRAVMAPVVRYPDRLPPGVVTTFVRDMAECQAMHEALGRPESRRLGRIHDVDVPTTIVWSGADRVLSGPWAREGFRHVTAKHLDLPDVGHLPMLDAPGAVARLVEERVRSASPPIAPAPPGFAS